MKIIYSFIAAALLLTAALNVNAQNEKLKIRHTDGTEQTILISDIAEMVFEDATQADLFAGSRSGTQSVVVGGMFTYTADITCTVTANADGTVNLHIPEYVLPGTVMGDLTLGAHTISNIAWEETDGCFFRDYSSDGLSMHFTAVSNGTASMDKDYSFNPGSNVRLSLQDGKIEITDSFKLGAMPFPLVATFTQK